MPLAVISLGLLSALTWGLGDFGGGLVSRRAPVAGVLLVSQLAGAAMALAIAALLREPTPAMPDVGWAVGSSLVGVVGLASLYIGLARGRMGVVAPMTGVLVATTPAIAGIALQGVPPPAVLAGIGLAISSVVVVSRVGDAGDGRPSGLQWGIAAGLALGVQTITLSRIGAGHVFGPLTVTRLGEGVILGLVIVAATVRARGRPGPDAVAGTRGQVAIPWRISRRHWPAVLAVGACDMLGTGCYIAASQAGPLAIAGVLSALYPVTTVVLAVAILRERLASWHLVGVAMAAAAVVLITTGGAV
ncbi:MAG TPA: EamA family transporter [Candidatus Binatus sp.]|nr:EamA family transporter [Candidatus Binatus sp.]